MFTVTHRLHRAMRLLAAAAAILVAAAGLSLVTAESASADGAGQPFSCTVPTYFSEVSDGTNAQLYKGTYAASGATTWTAFGPQQTGAAGNYNGMGFNPVDGYIYAVVLNGTIVRIDSAGALTTIGTTTPALGNANTLWDSGTFGPDGTFYVANAFSGGTALVLNKITNITTTRTKTTVALPNIRFADLVYKDGFLWAHNYNQTSTIYRIDPNSGAVVSIASPLPVGAYGAEFRMGNGNLSFISASTMYQVQIDNPTAAAPTATLITSYAATANTRADATNCETAPAADLQITKTGPATVAPGATISWNIAVTNAGPGASSGFVVQDALPAGLSNVTATSSGATCTITGQTVVCNNAALANGATRNITVTATAPSTVGSIVNTATVLGNEADSGTGSNSSGPTTIVAVPPTAVNDDAGSVSAGSTATITRPFLLSNDSGTGIAVTSFTQPGHGVIASTGGNLTYTPTAGYSGSDSFTYTITGSGGGTATATVTITVAPIAPDAVDDNAGSVTAGGSKSITRASLLSNDTGTAIAISSFTQPAHGSITSTGGGDLVYVPATGYAGADSFTYTITGPGGTDTATVSLTVVPIAPVAVNDNAGSLVAGGSKNITRASLLANDSGTGIAVTAFTQPAHGSITSTGGGDLVYTPAANYSGADSFTYTITATGGATDSATVSLTVTPVAPDAVDDNAGSLLAGSSKSITRASLLSNDSGTAIAISSFTQPGHGTVTSTGGGDLVYTPAANYSGADSFTYTITGPGGTDTATVSLTVTPVAPDAIDDNAGTVTAGSTKAITRASLLSNDTGTAIAISSFTQPGHGTVTSTGGGDLVYTPTAGYAGADSFTYTITGPGGTDTATVSLTVAPVTADAVDDSAGSLVAGSSKTITRASLLSNDTGTAISFTSFAQPTHGTITTNGAGELVYTPDAGFAGADSFTYTITAAGGSTDSATVSLTVNPVATDAVDDNAGTVVAGSVKNITRAFILSNDTGTAIAISSFTQPGHGTVTTTAGGDLVYTPTADFSGADSFDYTITGPGGTDTATVSIVVTPVAPHAVNDNAGTLVAGGSKSITRAFLLANDSGTAIAVTSFTQPGNGTVTSTGGGDLVYTPNAGFSGADSFTYTITGPGGTDSATVSLSVTPVAPDAVDDNAGSLLAGSSKSITRASLLSNDSGTAIAISSFTQPGHGTVTSTGGGDLVYTPAANYSGADSFTYTITGPGGTDTATVSLTVTPVAPDAVDDSVAAVAGTPKTITRASLLSNDTGTAISFSSFTQPGHGSIATNAAGEPVYTSAAGFSGTDTFTYTISGPGGTDTATVTITVAPVAPDAVDDSASATAGSSSTITRAFLLSNDIGTAIAVSSFTQPAHGSIATNGAGELVYTPSAGYSGSDAFTYTITGPGGSDTANVTIAVAPVAPDAVDDAASTIAGSPVTITRSSLLANDSGTAISITSHTAPSHGSLTTNAAGEYVYTPVAGFTGTDSFDYTITGPGGTDTATVTITVSSAAPIAPDAVDDNTAVSAGSSATIPDASLLANDSGTGISVTSVTAPGHGTLVRNAAGDLVYTPNAGFSGSDSFDYTITGPGGTDTATVTITVVPVAPDAVDDSVSTTAGAAKAITRPFLLSNDAGTAITVTGFTQPGNGTVTSTGGDLTYTPNTGFSGTDAFTYTISGPGGTDTATVSVSVTPVAPHAVDDSASVVAGSSIALTRALLLSNDSGTAISVSGNGQPAHGTVTTDVSTGNLVYTPYPGYSGPDAFTYSITGPGGTDSASVALTVTPLATNAVDDTVAATSDTPATITRSSLLSNDTGTALTVTAFTQPQHGALATDAAGNLVYTPNVAYSGTDTFTYTAGGAGGSDTATVTITVAPVAPVANDDSAAAPAATPTTITRSALLGNDSGTAIAVSGFTQPAHGTITTDAAGDLVYTSTGSFVGADVFTYTITGPGGTDSASVTVTVTAIAPDAVDDSIAATAGSSTTIPASTLLANDSGTAIALSTFTQPGHGTVTQDAAGDLVYTPTTGYSGSDSFTYTITGPGGTDTATVTVTNSPVAPHAADDTAATLVATPVTVATSSMLANDSGTAITVTGFTQAGHGSVTADGTGGLVYLPAAGFSGADSFQYTITGSGGTDTAKVLLTVAPIASADTAATSVATPVTVAVLGNDLGLNRSVTAAGPAAHGSVTRTATSVTYTPAAGFSGTDSFAYTLTADGGTDTATVTVTVAPIAVDDSATTTAGAAITVSVLGNDLGINRTVTAATDGAHGTVTFTASGVVYTPAAGFSGTDVFSYTLTGDGGSDTAGVTVTVTPTAATDTFDAAYATATTFDPRGNDRGTTLTVTAATDGAHGSVTFTATGVTYTPNGSYSGTDVFGYTVTDATNQSISSTITVLVHPASPDDVALTTVNAPITVDVLANDGGSGLTLVSVTAPAHGTATIVAGKVLYTPAADFSGVDTFQYVSRDGVGTPGGATVTISITPAAAHDTANASAGTPVVLTPLHNDDGTSLVISSATVPAAQGTVTINPGGTLSYSPAPGFSGPATVTYTVTDPDMQSSTATITVTVAPTAVSDSVIVSTSPQVIAVLGNDLGSGIRLVSFTAASHGIVRMLANGTITYTPDVGFVGGDLFTYALQDAFGTTATTTVSVTVLPLATTGTLATTGVNPTTPALLSILLLLLGMIFVVIRRRRPRGRHL